jgi:hypothetical protein
MGAPDWGFGVVSERREISPDRSREYGPSSVADGLTGAPNEGLGASYVASLGATGRPSATDDGPYSRERSGEISRRSDAVSDPPRPYSHSMVAGGFEEMSYTTRLMPRTSLMMRDEMRARSSCGSRAQSAVIPSVLCTARSAHTRS